MSKYKKAWVRGVVPNEGVEVTFKKTNSLWTWDSRHSTLCSFYAKTLSIKRRHNSDNIMYLCIFIYIVSIYKSILSG